MLLKDEILAITAEKNYLHFVEWLNGAMNLCLQRTFQFWLVLFLLLSSFKTWTILSNFVFLAVEVMAKSRTWRVWVGFYCRV